MFQSPYPTSLSPLSSSHLCTVPVFPPPLKWVQTSLITPVQFISSPSGPGLAKLLSLLLFFSPILCIATSSLESGPFFLHAARDWLSRARLHDLSSGAWPHLSPCRWQRIWLLCEDGPYAICSALGVLKGHSMPSEDGMFGDFSC